MSTVAFSFLLFFEYFAMGRQKGLTRVTSSWAEHSINRGTLFCLEMYAENQTQAPLSQQGVLSLEGSIWTIDNFHLSGILGESGVQQKCFVRHEMVILWNRLNHELNVVEPGCERSNHALSITGDASVGKSTTLYGWTTFIAQFEPSPVLWVSVSESSRVTVVCFQNKVARYERHDALSFAEVVRLLTKRYSPSPPRIVVLDGFNSSKATKAVISIKLNFSTSFIIHCASTGYLKLSGAALEALCVSRHFVCAWAIEELVAAWKLARAAEIPLFPTRLLMSPKAFQEQAYYAGGSIELMKMEISCVQCIINEGTDALASGGQGLTAFAQQLRVSHHPSPAPYRLTIHVRDSDNTVRVVPASQYAVHCLTRRAHSVDDILTARQLLSRDPMCQEWCIEL